MVGEASTTWAGGLLHTRKERAGEAEGLRVQGSLPLKAQNHHANMQVGVCQLTLGQGPRTVEGKGPRALYPPPGY